MSDIEEVDQPHVAEITEVAEETSRNGSLMETLRQRRDENASHKTVLIPLVGYEEQGLKVQYRLIDRSVISAIQSKVQRQVKDRGEYMWRVIIDTMIAACDGFYLAPNGIPDDEAEPLMAESDPNEHVGSFAKLASELRGSPFDNHRAAIVYVFGGNDFTAGQHGLLLNRWLSNTGLDIDQEFLDYQG